MAIQVLETALVHEAIVTCRLRFTGAGRECLVHHRVHRRAAVGRQAGDHLGVTVRIGNRLVGELLEERLRQQHHEDALADHHAGRIVIGEGRVEAVAQRGEEGLGRLQVLHGQVDEDHLWLRCTHR
ncbi:hypothetical protein G6F64_015116 [Rhizopus arrhizus]|uniref:Uncharacterized protein n=1 Tax=Rhizopus oryzae TaxID=64495 RepID=A0A9P6WS58_RHIOR|nr:hypothetical protein G6F64_015116 [Rhizopus arrhizus]